MVEYTILVAMYGVTCRIKLSEASCIMKLILLMDPNLIVRATLGKFYALSNLSVALSCLSAQVLYLIDRELYLRLHILPDSGRVLKSRSTVLLFPCATGLR